MGDIYEQHRAAFANVSAFVILDAKGERVASVAFKYPRDGAGRLYAYVHYFCLPMVRGWASGGGYDKHSAALSVAMRRAKDLLEVNRWDAGKIKEWDTFRSALAKDDGFNWDHRLRAAGFVVWQAV